MTDHKNKFYAGDIHAENITYAGDVMARAGVDHTRRAIEAQENQEAELDRLEGLMSELERNDKYLTILREELQVLYDRLTPILTPERPTEEKESVMKSYEAEGQSELRIQVRRQRRLIESIIDRVRQYTERIEL